MDPERLLRRLSEAGADAEYELDLRGLDRVHAEESVRRMLERTRFTEPRSVRVRLQPPPEGGGETLFQPIGRLLLQARRQGVLNGLSPLSPEIGVGYWIETAGRKEPDTD
ncbi:hypothetical protein [Thalassobaculum sp.]|uniref:hypothetical protein n=1 Tax=Thalassobaculum sp. TaxID=2022740 RepID=UPI0032F06E11